VKALITEGTVSRLYMEAAGLNVANVVYEKLFGQARREDQLRGGRLRRDQRRCWKSRVFALDTDDAVINMDGHIDFADRADGPRDFIRIPRASG